MWSLMRIEIVSEQVFIDVIIINFIIGTYALLNIFLTKDFNFVGIFCEIILSFKEITPKISGVRGRGIIILENKLEKASNFADPNKLVEAFINVKLFALAGPKEIVLWDRIKLFPAKCKLA